MTVRSGGGFDVTLSELEKAEASAVLAEWLQSHDAPEAGRTLYGVLTS